MILAIRFYEYLNVYSQFLTVAFVKTPASEITMKNFTNRSGRISDEFTAIKNQHQHKYLMLAIKDNML